MVNEFSVMDSECPKMVNEALVMNFKSGQNHLGNELSNSFVLVPVRQFSLSMPKFAHVKHTEKHSFR
jgi:hypothetical protein